jgi:hypothetical protein
LTQTPEKSASIVVVTGLPRSGTSLLMQMLRAGGMQLLVDDQRQPDDHNPRGYFEYEPVKRIETDHSWLADACGKAVKVVVPLVNVIGRKDIPAIVLLVRREMGAVLRSQKRMAEAYWVNVSDEEQLQLAEVFERELEETVRLVKANPVQELVEVRYEDILANPLLAANRISSLLPACLDMAAMAFALDKSLNRSGGESGDEGMED